MKRLVVHSVLKKRNGDGIPLSRKGKSDFPRSPPIYNQQIYLSIAGADYSDSNGTRTHLDRTCGARGW